MRTASQARLSLPALALLLSSACATPGSAPTPPRTPAVGPPPSHTPVVVPDCSTEEVAYFHCLLDSPSPGAVAVCGHAGPDGIPTDLQVRLLAPDGTTIVLPSEIQDARAVLSMSVSARPQFQAQLLSFRSDGRLWTIFSEHDVQLGPGVPMRGLRVRGQMVDPSGWTCADGVIDRLGELEPLLAAERDPDSLAANWL